MLALDLKIVGTLLQKVGMDGLFQDGPKFFSSRMVKSFRARCSSTESSTVILGMTTKGTGPIRQIYANTTGECAIGYQHLNANASARDCEIVLRAKS